MMKLAYETPEIDVISFETDSIIMVGGVDGAFGDGDTLTNGIFSPLNDSSNLFGIDGSFAGINGKL